MAKCAHHLPGNVQCPNAAIYEISWVSLGIYKAYDGSPLSGDFKRAVCINHLAPAIDDALGDSARGSSVRVGVPSK